MNHIFFYMWMAEYVLVTYLCKRWHQDVLWEEGKPEGQCDALANVLLESLSPGIDVDANLICTLYLTIVSGQIHPFMVTVILNDRGFFQQDNVLCYNLNPLEHLWDVLNEQVQSAKDPHRGSA